MWGFIAPDPFFLQSTMTSQSNPTKAFASSHSFPVAEDCRGIHIPDPPRSGAHSASIRDGSPSGPGDFLPDAGPGSALGSAWHPEPSPGMQPPALTVSAQPHFPSPGHTRTLTCSSPPPKSHRPQPSAKGQRFPPHIFHVRFKPPEDHCSGEKSQLQSPSPHLDFVI